MCWTHIAYVWMKTSYFGSKSTLSFSLPYIFFLLINPLLYQGKKIGKLIDKLKSYFLDVQKARFKLSRIWKFFMVRLSYSYHYWEMFAAVYLHLSHFLLQTSLCSDTKNNFVHNAHYTTTFTEGTSIAPWKLFLCVVPFMSVKVMCSNKLIK